MIPVEFVEWMIKCMLIMVFVIPILSGCVLFGVLACWMKNEEKEGEACEQG